jgi:hypothetical protein
MTDTAPTAPTPNEVPTLGDTLSYSGLDANGNKSTQGLTAQAWSIDDPTAVFTFTPSADQSTATIVPNSAVVGQATVTFACTDSAGAPLSATWLAEVLPAVSVSISAEPIPVPEAPVEAAPAEAPAA